MSAALLGAFIAPKKERVFVMGTVSSVDPLTVILDGDSTAIPCFSIVDLMEAHEGSRVILLRLGRQYVIVGAITAKTVTKNDFDEHITNTTDAHDIDKHFAATAEDDVHGLAGAVIVDSGSNTNGSWVRWSNGLQVCWQTTTAVFSNSVRSADIDWTFPVAFKSPPFVAANSYNSATYLLHAGYYGGLSAAAVSRIAFGNYSEPVTRTNPAALFAIGWWK